MVRIDLNNESIEQNISSVDSIEIYRDDKLIGRYTLDKPDAITELEVSKLLDSDSRYFVPAYQRGYRWTEQQVKELLDDIWNWKENARYSLQPIVINQLDNGMIELVDGQQRLTTMYIILKAVGILHENSSYQIEYQTRKGTAEFLAFHLFDEDKSSENIDWYFMHRCYILAEEYFKSHDPQKWVNKLLNKDTGAFFIQYQILKDVDNRKSEQIFKGLNAGKIPLTNSELVKALILRENNFKNETYYNEFVEIAQEWDRIEKKLQEPNFWAWLGQESTNDSPRIDMILDIVADLIKEDQQYNIDEKEYQEFYSYKVINKYFIESGNEGAVASFWKKVKQCFMTFEDWYEDNESYHLIGYLSLTGKKKKIIKRLYNQYLNSVMFDLKNHISQVNFSIPNYGSGDDARNRLLLFNIITCINTKSRFRFNDYLQGHYDIEHISPHSGFDRINKKNERIEWMESIRDSKLDIFSSLLFDNIKETAENDEAFLDFYNSAIGLTETQKWDNECLDRLGNLCLLDAKTNRGYGNKPFPLKVKEIVSVDMKQSRYLLPTTKNVFLKYYSDLNVNNLIWDESDAQSYERVIQKTMSEYFGWKEKTE